MKPLRWYEYAACLIASGTILFAAWSAFELGYFFVTWLRGLP